jgi:hypothetical protein
MAGFGAALIGLTAVGIIWPVVLAAPIVLIGGWVGIALLVRAIEIHLHPLDQKPVTPEKKQNTPPQSL